MPPDALDSGDQVARFTLRARLGEGGMGQVWRARDPELERDVAVKLLRPEVATSSVRAEEARARLRREAQAMARLAHPNVIAVYEVGEADARVFLVMELVDGGTLTEWLAARSRTPAAILDVFVQAGRGLVAAHAAGLVHRDFKPDNVLVGTDGRTRVTDFGLVGLERSAAEVLDDGAGAAGDPRTRTGAILGTPAYAAPEVLRGAQASAQSDQFSFCVALYEALWGRPPFAGDTIADLFDAVTAGAVRPPPAEPAVRAEIRDAVLRGLATDPDRRWPSMAALLVALTPPARRGRAWWIGAGAVAAAGGLAAVAVATGGVPTTATTPATSLDDGGAPRPRLAAVAAAPLSPPIALTDTGGCAESPVIRGDQVVYAHQATDGSTRLHRVPLAGGPSVPLSELPLSVPVAGSAPDRVIAVWEGKPARLIEIDLAGRVVELPSPPSLSSPVGFVWHAGALFYARPDRAQIRMIEGGVERALAELPAGHLAVDLALSPDGRWVLVGTGGEIAACVLDRHAAAPRWACVPLPLSRGNLMVASADAYLVTGQDGTWLRRFDGAGEPRLVSPTLIDGMAMTMQVGGDTVVASHCMRRARLVALPPDASAPRVILDGRFTHLAARGDGQLAMARYVDTVDTVLSVRDHGGAMRDLTPADHIVREPAWNAAGTLLAYRRAALDGGIYVVDLAPSPPRRVTGETTDTAPVFLADGRLVFARVTAPGVTQMFVADPATGEVGPAPRPDRRPYDRHPRDGRVLVGDPRQHRMWLWDPTTGREVEVARSDDPAADVARFAPDGASIIATWRDGVWRLPVAGGAARELYRPAVDAAQLDGAVELPDGTVLVAERYYRGELHRTALPISTNGPGSR